MPRGDQKQQQPEPPAEAWHALSGEDVAEKLETSPDGLSDEEAARRLKEHGPNRLRQEKARPWWIRLLAQFNNVLIIVLLIAGTVTAVLQQWIDAGAIFAVVIINALIGFFQEGKAEKALESIKVMLAPKASVQRAGQRKEIDAEEVVPGDVVIIDSGDRVPADMRLLEANRLRTDEAPLTGESEPVDKGTEAVDEDAELADRTCMAHAGTMVAQGGGKGIVVATGAASQIGRISEMVSEVEEVKTPLLRQIDRFAKVLAGVILAVAGVMAAYGVLVQGYGWREMFLSGVGLAVAAIPQGLPALVTITLALGVQRMAKRNAIIRKLPAVETLGSVSTIFSDKTGTLTRNEMTAQVIALSDGEVRVTGVGFAPEGTFRRPGSEDAGEDGPEVSADDDPLLARFLRCGVLCNESHLTKNEESGEWTLDGDPTEGALVVAAAKAGWDPDKVRDEGGRSDVIPFDSERKYMATLDEDGLHVKGAPEVILDLCDKLAGVDEDTDLDRNAWKERMEALSSRGVRVLALADKPGGGGGSLSDEDVEGGGLVLIGLVGLLDPPREEAIDAVGRCHDAGIEVKMVTGDHALTARAIGKQLGLSHVDEALTGRDVADLSDEALQKKVAQVDVFARAAPEHKLRLVEAVQADGYVAAMTGDGVNDAPALKRADVGVAMGIQGTEAAKETAEMVLADDNFASIANAVEEGRVVYDNIRKAITFLLPTNGGEALAIMGAILLATELPITPVQILWINMITAVTLGLAFAFEPAEANVMKRAPRDPKAPILDRFLVWRVVFVSLMLVAAVFGLFLWELRQGTDTAMARTLAVNILVAGEIAYLFNTRRPLERSLSMEGLFGSRPALLATAGVIVAQIGFTYWWPMQVLFDSAALSVMHWAYVAGVAAVIFLAVEAEKAVRRRRR